MRIVTISLVLLVFVSICHSQFNRDTALFPVEVNGKTGYIDRSGRIAIEPRFDAVGDFHDGLARVEVDDKWGYIDLSGRMVIEPKYVWAHDFSEGLARVQFFGVIFREPRSYGFIDKKGEVAIKPAFDELHGVGDDAEGFQQGRAMVERDGRKGFIDKKGNLVIGYRFDSAYHFTPEGLASVKSPVNKNWGYIDRNGRWAIPPRYRWGSLFSEGLAPVNRLRRCGFINTHGDFILHPFKSSGDCPTIWGHFNGGLSRWKIDGQFGYIDKNANVVVPSSYKLTDGFSEGMAPVSDGKLWGFINTNGELVIAPKFEFVSAFRNGLSRVSSNEISGYIDKLGRFVWKSSK